MNLKKQDICIQLKSLGYRYDSDTGHIIGPKGSVLTNKSNGYISFYYKKDGKRHIVYGHQFAYFSTHGYVPDCIDHINRIKDDNRIVNLRDIPKHLNQFNMYAKGYCWNKAMNKFEAYINVNSKKIQLGYFDKEIDAKEAYLAAKKTYHVIL